MAVFNDTFTDTDGTLLTAHTPDTGTSWTQLWSDATTNLEVRTNQCTPIANSANTGFIYTADATYPSADYDIVFTLVAASSVNRTFLLLVRLQDQENMYAVLLNGGTNNCSLYKKVGGTWTALGSAFTIPDNGSVCKLEIIGSALKFYDDGVEIASATDTDITAAGKAGIAFGGGAELIDTTHDIVAAYAIDTVAVTDLGTGGDPTPSASDSVTVSDSASLTPIVIPDLQESEAVTVTESVKAELTIDVAASEAVTIGEATALDPVAPTEAVASDAVTVTDTAAVDLAIEIRQSEAVTVTDTDTVSVVSIADLSISVSDAVSVVDAASIDALLLDVATSDAVTVADASSLDLPIDVAESEAVTLVEAVSIDPLLLDVDEAQAVTVADAASLNVTVEGAINISVSDSVSVGDTASLENALLGINVALDNPFYIVTGVKVVS